MIIGQPRSPPLPREAPLPHNHPAKIPFFSKHKALSPNTSQSGMRFPSSPWPFLRPYHLIIYHIPLLAGHSESWLCRAAPPASGISQRSPCSARECWRPQQATHSRQSVTTPSKRLQKAGKAHPEGSPQEEEGLCSEGVGRSPGFLIHWVPPWQNWCKWPAGWPHKPFQLISECKNAM